MKWIALLRGVNVGGRNALPMARLREALKAAGFGEVRTYIQSGNVLLESALDERALKESLQRIIRETFGLSVEIVLRTETELAELLAGCPFTEAEIAGAKAANPGESRYVTLYESAPDCGQPSRFTVRGEGIDQAVASGRDVYLLLRQSIRDAKLAADLAKISLPQTTRNWNTLSKLLGLMRESE